MKTFRQKSFSVLFKETPANSYVPRPVLPAGLFQYSDWDWHNKLLTENEIFIYNKPLIKYRVSNNSASAANPASEARSRLETDLMLDYFLNIKDLDLFKKIFKGVYEQFGEPETETIPYFLGRIALLSPDYSKQRWGYKTIMKFISQNNNFNILNSLYSETFGSFISLCPVKAQEIHQGSTEKYKKYKMLYNLFLFLSLILLFALFTFFAADIF